MVYSGLWFEIVSVAVVLELSLDLAPLLPHADNRSKRLAPNNTAECLILFISFIFLLVFFYESFEP